MPNGKAARMAPMMSNAPCCHGEITSQNVSATPALSTCDTCHAEQVAQLKSDPFMKGKTCVTCHPPHTFMPHKKAAAAGKKDIDPADYVPACAEACPTGAIRFLDLNAQAPPADSFRLLERLGTDTKIYYHSKKDWVKRNG